MLTARYISDFLNGKQVGPNQWVAPCPCGPHSNAKLYLSDGRNGKVLMDCKHPSCDYYSVKEALIHIGAIKPEWTQVPNSKTAASLKSCREQVALLREIWESCEGAVSSHPYAIKKGIDRDFGARRGMVRGAFPYEADCIVIPMFSLDGKPCGLECINEEGHKRAVGKKGWNLQGNYKSPNGILHMVEGWATGFAVAEDFPFDHGVIICFGGGSIEKFAWEAEKRLGKRTYIHREPNKVDYWDLKHQNPTQAKAYVEAVLEEVSKNER